MRGGGGGGSGSGGGGFRRELNIEMVRGEPCLLELWFSASGT